MHVMSLSFPRNPLRGPYEFVVSNCALLPWHSEDISLFADCYNSDIAGIYEYFKR